MDQKIIKEIAILMILELKAKMKCIIKAFVMKKN